MIATRTSTIEPMLRFVHQVRFTGASVQTGVGSDASGQLDGAVFAAVRGRTVAEVAGTLVHARAVFTWTVAFTLIDIHLAMHALEAGFTLARIPAHLIRATAPSTWVGFTLVDVDLTVRTGRSWNAQTLVPFRSRIIELLRENLR